MTITITTPLYYVNDKPHLGSTYTTLACDTYARFQRLQGKKVKFVTGVDEHGQKIQLTAELNNLSPIDHCNNISSLYKDLWNRWNITNDTFIRTTSPRHQELVYKFFDRVNRSGDIVIGKQTGWYCIGCEEYKDVSDSNKPTCPLHLKELEWRDEENLFFRLSKYQNQIESLVSSPTFIHPNSRRNEVVNFVKKGLRDFSISRQNVKWGIPVPGYKGQTFYVWFDALLGYISALIEPGAKIDLDRIEDFGWPASVHVIGKDILRFHAVYWPAMLLSAGLKGPQKVYGHGFLTREGQKMGKSLGNVLDPKELLEQYGADTLRWYLLSDISFGKDGDFQLRRFKDLVNSDLANTIGNLLNRTSTMSRKWFNNRIPTFSENTGNISILENMSKDTIVYTIDRYEAMDFKGVSEKVIQLASEANTYLNENEPWSAIKSKDNRELVGYYIYNVLETCRIVGFLLSPIIPEISLKIIKQLGYKDMPLNWTDDLKWGVLKQGMEIPESMPVFLKLEN